MSRKLTGLSLVERERLPRSCADCVFWESDQLLPRECGSACDAALAARWGHDVVEEWGEYGRAVVDDGEVLGFVKFAPAGYFPQARYMPSGPPLDGLPLMSCMHIAPEARQRGVGGVLIRAALRDLAARGERSVQAYATTRRGTFEYSPLVGVDFLLRTGFTVERAHPEVPLLKLELRTLATWTDNLEAVLESLRLPVRVPNRSPVPLASVPERR
jgi:GNAT superfamily N-acetyltransferase